MTRTPKGRATCETFVTSAAEVFARLGYLNTRIEDIAEAAGKAPGTFYLYFPNGKKEVLARLATDFNDELQERVAAHYRSGQQPPAALRGAISEFWHHHRERLGTLMGIFQASLIDRDCAAIWHDIRADGVRTIARGIRQAQADGFCPGLDPDIAASALSAMIEYFCYVWQVVGGEDPDIDLTDDRAIDTLWTLWAQAIYWTEPLPHVLANDSSSPATAERSS